MNCVTWNGEIFVATGYSRLTYSNDGIQWNDIKIGQNDFLNYIEWNGNTFIAVGYYDKFNDYKEIKKALVLSSTDGINWTRKELDTCQQLNCVKWNGNEFVASGNNGTIISSTDGVNWVKQSTDTNQNIIDLEFVNSRMIALTENNSILSKDGNYKQYIPEYLKKINITFEYNWKKAEISSPNGFINNVIWNGSIFIATNSSEYVLTSYDGIKWDRHFVDKGIRTFEIIKNKSQLILLAHDSMLNHSYNNNSYIYTSQDGLAWKKTNFNSDKSIDSIAANGSAIISYDINSGIIYKSNDSIKWYSFKSPITDPFSISRIFEYNGNFYLISSNKEIYISKDGKQWDKTNLSGPLFKPVSNGVINTFYSDGILYKSTDGKTWSKLSDYIEDLASDNYVWNGKEFIGISYYGNVIRSTDGVKWDYDKPMKDQGYKSMAWNGHTLVVLSSSGDIYYAVPNSIIKVKINGKPQKLDISPKILNNRTMIPLRSIFEACGIEVKWDDKKKTVSAVKGQNKLLLKADSKIALVNNKEKTLDASPSIINNRMYIPLRFVSESFGFKVKWSGDTNTVEINTN